ncbi:MAG: hypothetical protein Q9209_005933 [Squamulea sp. 1 TL-2023]
MNGAVSVKQPSRSIGVEKPFMNGFGVVNVFDNTATDGAPHFDAAKTPASIQTSRGLNDLNGSSVSIDRFQHNDEPASTHSSLVYHLFRTLQGINRKGSVEINGEELDISTLSLFPGAVRYGACPNLDERPQYTGSVADSVTLLDKLHGEGETIYGVNTGFGGSADTRSDQNQDLQSALLQLQQFGVLTANDRGLSEASGGLLASHAMPETWVRGTMLVRGTAEGFNSFIAKVRPHRGQVETARNIQDFLRGSHLARGLVHDDDSPPVRGLFYQDRYALRTAAQWIGPLLEDILLVHQQVTTELNSTTDNPLVDVAGQKVHHGGSFQAVLITLAMEKLRLSLQMFEKLLFVQCTELINPTLNNGLPRNLAADEPMSELAFLANPVSSHVQTTKMHNQAINSLALVSTRYTLHAIELVSLMIASHLYTVCQALDLRVLQMSYSQALEPWVHAANEKGFHHLLSDADFAALHKRIWEHIQAVWLQLTTKDSVDRCTHVIDSALEVIVKFLISSAKFANSLAFEDLSTWRNLAIDCLAKTYINTRGQFFQSQNTANCLGNGTRKLFVYVRETLGVPFHHGLRDHPSPKDDKKKLMIGSWISVIYEALRDGRLHGPVMESLVEAEASYSHQ